MSTEKENKERFIICDNMSEFMQVAKQLNYSENKINAAQKFFEFMENFSDVNTAGEFKQALNENSSSGDAIKLTEDNFENFLNGLNEEKTKTAELQLINNETDKVSKYITGLLNPLASSKSIEALNAAKRKVQFNHNRFFNDMNVYEREILNFIVMGGFDNLNFQIKLLETEQKALTQGGYYTYSLISKLNGYHDKKGKLAAKYAEAFETLGLDRFWFFDEFTGDIYPLEILRYNYNAYTEIKTYKLSPQFVNTLPVLRQSVLYYNVKRLTNDKISAGDIFKFRGDKTMLMFCLSIVSECKGVKRSSKLSYSKLIERAAAKEFNVKKSKDWKRQLKTCFEYLGYKLINGDSAEAKLIKGNPNYSDADAFIIAPLSTHPSCE